MNFLYSVGSTLNINLERAPSRTIGTSSLDCVCRNAQATSVVATSQCSFGSITDVITTDSVEAVGEDASYFLIYSLCLALLAQARPFTPPLFFSLRNMSDEIAGFRSSKVMFSASTGVKVSMS